MKILIVIFLQIILLGCSFNSSTKERTMDKIVLNETLKKRFEQHQRFLDAWADEIVIDYKISEVDITDVAPFIYE